jgi:hypothetical protein
VIFIVELAIRWIALGTWPMLADDWNKLDCAVVLVSIAGFIYMIVSQSSAGLLVNAIRTFRLSKAFKIVQRFKSLSNLMRTIVLTIPAIVNITLLLILVIFIFAVIGVSLFGKIGFNNSYYENANFMSVGIAILTLSRFTVGEGWTQFMFDAAASPTGCVLDPPYNPNMCGFNNAKGCVPLNGCGHSSIYPFLTVYIFVVVFVMMNLFISVVLECYNEINSGVITHEDFHRFCQRWAGIEYLPF